MTQKISFLSNKLKSLYKDLSYLHYLSLAQAFWYMTCTRKPDLQRYLLPNTAFKPGDSRKTMIDKTRFLKNLGLETTLLSIVLN